MPRRSCKLVFIATIGLGAICASAATVSVAVADRGGKPLADAVVMLAPASGHMPVRPLSGVEIAQARRQFNPRVTVVTVGTAIAFPNLDTVRHHVYSFSSVKTFELKLYAGVPAAPIVFDKPGIAVLGCNIHDEMVAWVVVVDTPLYARSVGSGKAIVEDVPAGNYELRIWHPDLAEAALATPMPLAVGSTDVQTRASLITRRRAGFRRARPLGPLGAARRPIAPGRAGAVRHRACRPRRLRVAGRLSRRQDLRDPGQHVFDALEVRLRMKPAT